jgi:hypothetical protein
VTAAVPLWLLFVLLVLAAYRITRLFVRDEIPLIKTPRDAIANWLDPRDANRRKVGSAPLGAAGRAIAYGMECDWCSSVWWSGVVVFVTDLNGHVPLPWLIFAATAGAAGLLSAVDQRLEQRSRHTELQITELHADLRRRGILGTAT